MTLGDVFDAQDVTDCFQHTTNPWQLTKAASLLVMKACQALT